MNSQSSFAPDAATSNANGDWGAYSIRAATPQDEPILWRLLCHATLMPNGDTPDNVLQAKKHVVLSKYVEKWGNPGDVGVIVESASGQPMGAAWVRPNMSGAWREQGVSIQLYGAEVEDDAPELVIAIFPQFRNRGLGKTLLNELLFAASSIHPSVQLNVREENPAVRLYERAGFITIGEMTNRVGGRSLAMRKQLSAKRNNHA